MTARAPEELRVKPVHSPWRLPGAWMTSRGIAWIAACAVVVLFSTLWFLLRERPSRHGDPVQADQERERSEARSAPATGGGRRPEAQRSGERRRQRRASVRAQQRHTEHQRLPSR